MEVKREMKKMIKIKKYQKCKQNQRNIEKEENA